MRWILRVAALVAVVSAGWPGSAGAAYQIMALIASADPVTLNCARGECAAEFSAFCLQPERASPMAGARYYAVGGDGLEIAATTADGRRIRLAAADHLRFTAARGHNAVRISIPLATLRTLGLKDVAVVVGERVSLVPEPIAGDPDPLSEADIALATGPLRTLGARIVDHSGDAPAAARLTNDLINALPDGGRAAPEFRAGLWRNAEKTWSGRTITAGAAAVARDFYDRCHTRMIEGSVSTMRVCLGSLHDRLVGGRNNAYWEAVKVGS